MEINWSDNLTIQRKSYKFTLEKMNKEEYAFPHNNWYLEFTEEERSIVDNWRINIIKYSTNPCPSNFINYSGAAGLVRLGVFVKITFSQFKEYILNIKEEPIINKQQDYSYLIQILTQLNNELRTN